MGAATAKAARAALKAKGWTSNLVSVRTGASSIRATIYTSDISKAEVEAVLAGFESISRCEASGEILSGGNTFVFVEYAPRVLDTLVSTYMTALEYGSQTFPGGYTVVADPERSTWTAYSDKSGGTFRSYSLGGMAEALAERTAGWKAA